MAELAGLPSPRMDWNAADLLQAFKKFKATCQLYFSGPLKEKSEEEQISYLLIWTGDEGIELVSTWSLTETEQSKLETYWTKFEEFVAPKSNFRLARYKFRTLKQEKGESVDSFIKKVRILAKECKYTNIDEHIIDALIFGSSDSRVQAKLLEHDATLTLNKAIDIARTAEATTSQLADIRSKESHTTIISTLKNCDNKQHFGKACGNCGTKHDQTKRSLCPAYNSECRKCHKLHHWERVCRSKEKKPLKDLTKGRNKGHHGGKPSKQVHELNQDESKAAIEPQLYFHSLKINSLDQSTQVFVDIQVNSGQVTKTVPCKIDTGAEGNVISLDLYTQLHPHSSYDSKGRPLDLAPSSTNITAFGGHVIEQYGTCMLTLSHNGKGNKIPFHVVNTSGPTILGLPTCNEMQLVTFNHSLTTQKLSGHDAKATLLHQYADCFNGIGCFDGEFHITLDPAVPPVIHPPRRVPEALREPLKKELETLEAQGIITKVSKPTDWVNSLVCVTKPDGSLRLCLDPKDLNKAIKRPHHCTPTIDEILPKLNGAQYFSIVDARSGYWNIKLDYESSLYTTFNTPHGRYRFLRLPFGLICAQDIFQKKVDEAFGDLPGVAGIADDIVVSGKTLEEHDQNLKAVMERARQTGIRFNSDKCQIACSELSFFGHVIGADGLKPDPRKVEAIRNMDPSTSLTDLQTFLGMVQFLGRFIPNLASASAVLWDLTKNANEFQWNPEHQAAVDSVKCLITSPSSLQYFDGGKPVIIQVDASTRGLGATLYQDKGPVEYRSKLLTETERRYSNIEREMLGIVYGLEKFHYYAYGRHVTIETDHKPLEAIFKKHLSSTPPRIARMMLRIQKYDVEIKYVPGKDIPLADALSRLNPCKGDAISGLDVSVNELNMHLNASPTRIQQIQIETAKDPTLNVLKSFISHGWPDKRSDCPSHLHGYWNYREELTVANGLILKGTRIVIPKKLQPEVLEQLHYAHQGGEKCKLRAKGSVFWAGINADIENMVRNCNPCQHNQRMNVKEPLRPHDIPPRAWHTLGSDLFFWNNESYLLVSDYYSKFPLVRKLSNIQSNTVIAHMKSIFEEHGIPSKLVTGNDTQFTSSSFQEFSKLYGFEHVTTSPYYPQANGFIERNVQTVKNLLQKCKESGSDPHLAMLCLRTTPINHNLPSPAELLNSRTYQSNLPGVTKPALFSEHHDVNAKLQVRQDQQKFYYDRSSRELSEVYPGDDVRVFNPFSHQWESGVVKDKGQTPKSYTVDMSCGSTLKRNRRHIRPSQEPNSDAGDDTQNASMNDAEPLTSQNINVPASPCNNVVEPSETPKLRRSTRISKRPDRLNL